MWKLKFNLIVYSSYGIGTGRVNFDVNKQSIKNVPLRPTGLKESQDF